MDLLRSSRLLGRLCLLSTLCACGDALVEPQKPMGALPSAVTTAEPEWLPFTVRAGQPFDEDRRERRLLEIRRLTQGYDVSQIAWSPDGRSLAIAARGPGDTRASALVVSLTSRNVQPRPSSQPDDDVRSVDFAWPSADRVLFVTRAGAIVSAKLDGSDRRAIDVGRPASGAAVSRDGSMLFYFGRSEAGAGAGLYAARADGTGTRPIDAKRARAEGVATSSDLARLAWATERERGGGPGAIVVASTEGRGVRPITPEAAAARAPTFHPNSRTIGFASDRDASAFEVYVADVTTGSEADLPLAERVTFSQGDLPSFSADGAHLAFASRRGGATLDLYVARWIEDP